MPELILGTGALTVASESESKGEVAIALFASPSCSQYPP